MMLTGSAEILRAADFAARKHAAQRRKSASADPYVNHLIEVSALLARTTGGGDDVLLVGALLHDAIEDVGVTAAQIEAEFGVEAAALVLEVTDDKSLPKQERKRLQIETAPKKSPRAKLLKTADMTSNIRGLADAPPVGWPPERIAEYLDWAEAVFAGVRGGCAALDAEFEQAVGMVRDALAERQGAAAQ